MICQCGHEDHQNRHYLDGFLAVVLALVEAGENSFARPVTGPKRQCQQSAHRWTAVQVWYKGQTLETRQK